MHKEREYNSVMYHLWYVHCLGLHLAQSLTTAPGYQCVNDRLFIRVVLLYTTGLMSYCYVVKRSRDSPLSSQPDRLRSDFQITFFSIRFFFLQLSSFVYSCYLIFEIFFLILACGESNYLFIFDSRD